MSALIEKHMGAAASGGRGAKTGRRGSRTMTAEQLKGWMCTNCGLLGHEAFSCTNPKDNDAPAKLKRHREEKQKARRRKDAQKKANADKQDDAKAAHGGEQSNGAFMAQMLDYGTNGDVEDDEGTFAAGEIKSTTNVMSSLCFMATAIPLSTEAVGPKIFNFTEIEKGFGIGGLGADNTAEEEDSDGEQEPPPPGCSKGGPCTCCHHDEAGAAEDSFTRTVATPTSTMRGSLTMLIYVFSVAVGAGAWALTSAFKTLNNPRKIMYEAEGLGQAAWRAFVIASLWGVVLLLTAALARLAVFMAGGDLGDPGQSPDHGATRPWNKRGPCRSALAGAALGSIAVLFQTNSMAPTLGPVPGAPQLRTMTTTSGILGEMGRSLDGLSRGGLIQKGMGAFREFSPRLIDIGPMRLNMSTFGAAMGLQDDLTERVEAINRAFMASYAGADTNQTWIDTGAERTLICDATKLINLRKCATQGINGINGTCHTSIAGDYWLKVPHPRKPNEEILLKDCLLVPECGINLISVAHLQASGVGTTFPRYDAPATMDFEIVKADAAPASTSTNTSGWSIDLVDMGTTTSVGGNRHLTIVTVLDTRFVRTYMHKTKDEFPAILLRALAEGTSQPKFIRSDGAPEYWTPAAETILSTRGIARQSSNAYEQAGNARAETMVHSIGKGIRAQLHSANLAPEFWGFAASNWVDIYNRLPHDSLDGLSPWKMEKGTDPDFSWFRPFGCRATVFLGKLRVDHHKISPRGEACISVGLGFSHGQKGWLLYSVKNRKLYCTRNALFDETFMPMRVTEQRIRGYGDPATRTQMLAEGYGTVENAESIPGEIEAALHAPFIPCGRAAPEHDFDTAPDPLDDDVPVAHTEADDLLASTTASDDLAPMPVPSPTHTPISGGAPVSGGVTHTPRSGGSGGGAPIGGGSADMSRSGGSGGDHDFPQPPSPAPKRGPGRPRKHPPTTLSGSASDASSNLSASPASLAGDPATQGSSDKSETDSWAKLGSRTLTQATDLEIARWCEGHAVDIIFTKQHWPRERSSGPWTGQVIGIEEEDGHLPRAAVAFSKPKYHVQEVAISTGTHNLRTAIAHSFPNASKLQDLVTRSRPQVAQQRASTRQAHRVNSWGAQGCKALLVIAGCLSATIGHDSTQGQLEQLADARTFGIRSDSFGASLVAYIATAQICCLASARGTQAAFEDLEPRNEAAARRRSDWPLWQGAGKTEVDTLFDFGCFEEVDEPENYDPLVLKFVYKLKVKDGDFSDPIYKARLVLPGDLQYEDEYTITYAPTARLFSLRTLCAIAAEEGLTLSKFDLKCAFVTADIDTVQYVTIPGHPVPKGKALLLKKALYGGRSSGALYQKDINKFLLDYGFTANSVDPTLYRLERGESVVLMSLYVDDGACATNDQFLLKEFLDALSKKYNLSDKGELEWHLGMRVEQDLEAGTVRLSQSAYVDSVLERFGMVDCNAVATPMIPHTYLSKQDCPEVADPRLVKYYQQLIGSLMYLACATRPDISMAVSSCAQFMQRPGPTHVEAAKHILRYLKGTRDTGITYGGGPAGSANEMYGYVDADHAGDKDDRKSVGGYVLMLNNGPISWSSKKIKVTSLSSFESEWYSASICGCEVEALRRLLEDLGYKQKSATVLFEDNAACIYSSDPDRPMSSRSKHIDTRVYRLRDLVRDGVLKLVKIETSQQMADGLTKALPAPAVAAFRSLMSGKA